MSPPSHASHASIHEEVVRAITEAGRAASGAAGGTFVARAAAIDLLEVHAVDRLQSLEARAALAPELRSLLASALALRQRLEDANDEVARRLRARIASGRYSSDGLRRGFLRYAALADGESGADPRGYGALDLLVARLLGEEPPAGETAEREPEMVAYQPTPARAILALVAQAPLDRGDVLFDLGSGLGHVVILAALLAGVRAIGVEREPAYCEVAARCARRLNLPAVTFLRGDARDAPLSEGTVFFLYTPFRGALLQRVLARLEAEAARRPIRVCTFGPCTREVAGARWLTRAGAGGGDPGQDAGPDAGSDAVTVFASLPPPT